MRRAVMQDIHNSILASQNQLGRQQQQQQHHVCQADLEQPQQEEWTQKALDTQPAWTTVMTIPQQEPASDAVMVVGLQQHPQPDGDDFKAPLLLPSSPVKPAVVEPSRPRCAALRELKLLLLLALPTIVTTAAQQIIIVTSQMFSGHIGTDAMAAAALSNTVRTINNA